MCICNNETDGHSSAFIIFDFFVSEYANARPGWGSSFNVLRVVLGLCIRACDCVLEFVMVVRSVACSACVVQASVNANRMS